jgi:hypothetical protein
MKPIEVIVCSLVLFLMLVASSNAPELLFDLIARG